jgi:hypothetical protein
MNEIILKKLFFFFIVDFFAAGCSEKFNLKKWMG